MKYSFVSMTLLCYWTLDLCNGQGGSWGSSWSGTSDGGPWKISGRRYYKPADGPEVVKPFSTVAANRPWTFWTQPPGLFNPMGFFQGYVPSPMSFMPFMPMGFFPTGFQPDETSRMMSRVTDVIGETEVVKKLDAAFEILRNKSSEACCAVIVCQVGARGTGYGRLADFIFEYFGNGYGGVKAMSSLDYALKFGLDSSSADSCRAKLATCAVTDVDLKSMASAALL